MMLHYTLLPNKQMLSLSTKTASKSLWIAVAILSLLINSALAIAQPTPSPSSPVKVTQAAKTILWVISTQNLKNPDDLKLFDGASRMFSQILNGSLHTHIIATKPDELAAWLKSSSSPLAECLLGLSPCSSPRSAALSTLGVDMILAGKLSRRDAGWTFNVAISSNADTISKQMVFTSPDNNNDGQPLSSAAALESVVFQAARELFNSTGSVEISTDPPGAQLSIDGKPVGKSPLTIEVPIGVHTIEASMANFGVASTSAKVGAARQTRVSISLASQVASIIIDTPTQGKVFVDDKPLGLTGQALELLPGEYRIEIRAEGYKPRNIIIVLAPKENKVMSMSLEADRPRLNLTGLGEVETEAIMARHFFFRGAYRFSRVVSGLQGATGEFKGETATLNPINLSSDPEAEPIRPSFGFHGLHLDLGYTWENWGLVALGFSLFSSADTTNGSLSVSGKDETVSLRDLSRIELKPAQLLWRYPYKNLLPQLQTGFGLASTSMTADTDSDSIELLRNAFFWHFSIEVNYYFDTWWFTYASLGIQRDLSFDDSKTQQLLSFGVGMTFENPLDEIGAQTDGQPPKTQ